MAKAIVRFDDGDTMIVTDAHKRKLVAGHIVFRDSNDRALASVNMTHVKHITFKYED